MPDWSYNDEIQSNCFFGTLSGNNKLPYTYYSVRYQCDLMKAPVTHLVNLLLCI